MIHEVNVSTLLLLAQTAGTNIKVVAASNNLLIVSSNQQSQKQAPASNTIPLQSHASVSYGAYTGIASSTLVFSQSAHPRVRIVSAESFLSLRQSVQQPKYQIVSSTLIFSHSAMFVPGSFTEQTLVLTQLAEADLVRGLNVSSTLNLQGVAGVYLQSENFTLLPQNVLVPQLSVYFTFEDQIITFQRPNQGNSLRFDFTRINRRTRGGDLVIFSAANWPKTKTLTLGFLIDNEKHSDKVKTFLQLTLGKEVYYHDHYGDVWLGFIMTPNNPIAQESPGFKSISLEFQGVKQ